MTLAVAVVAGWLLGLGRVVRGDDGRRGDRFGVRGEP
jgi:hypothetical protein